MKTMKQKKLNCNMLEVVAKLLEVASGQLSKIVAAAKKGGMTEEDAGRVIWAIGLLNDIRETLSDIAKAYAGEE